MQRLIEAIRNAKCVGCLTGAGVSTLCGIPDFRGPQGLYRQPNAERIFDIDWFDRDPSVYYTGCAELVYGLDRFQPGPVHRALKHLEDLGKLAGIATQNIDMLHQKAGSTHVYEVHGSPLLHHCRRCGDEKSFVEILAKLKAAGGVPRCQCGGAYKPDITFFGEALPEAAFAAAQELAIRSEVFLVLGTSLTVFPAAGLPRLTLQAGGKVFIVNAQPTSLDPYAAGCYRDLNEFSVAVSGIDLRGRKRMKGGGRMKAEDPAPFEDDVTLRLRRYPSCHLDGDEPSDWSIRLNLSPSGATISGSRQMPACDRKHPGLIERHRFRVSHAWAKALKLRLAAVRIPAMPNFVIGCDGEYRELVYEGIGGRAEYRWWSCPPDGWGAMNELYRDLYALFDAMASIRSAAPDRCSPHVRLYCTVAGTSHVAGIRQLTQDLEIGSSLMLERDYGNRCDSHAIAVLTEDGDRIGFIPKEQNRRLAELMADEAVFSAVVAGIKDRNKYREIKIHVIEHPRSIFRAAGA